jgi:iron complex outermembrane receptor protein
MAYAKVSRGYQAPGFNYASVSAGADLTFDAENLTSYEVGVKSQFWDRRATLNVAAFYYDYTDLQVSSFLNNLVVITNAAEATVQGVEVEALTQATDQLTLGLNLAWLDATYDEFLASYGTCGAAVAAQPDCAGVPIGVARPYDAEGNRLVNAPKWKATGSARYAVPLGELGTLDWLVQLTWTDDLYFTPINEEAVGQEAFALLDARVAWLSADARWELALLGRNLSDEEYYQNGVRFTSTTDPVRDLYNIGNALGYPAQGRSWAVQASYRF